MTRKTQRLLMVLVLLVLTPLGTASAQYSSSNYKSNEVFFGAGGDLSQSSSNYRSKVAVGELGVGNVAGTDYQAYAGFNTTDRPVLEVAVTGGAFDFGQLSTTQPSAITTIFTVRSYISSGYTVVLSGSSPTNDTHSLTPISPADSSHVGTEQFGVNLAANTLTGPGSFGAVPAQIPDTTFGFGAANSGYNTTNTFKYLDGDTIAHSDKSSGVTRYTLSMIANIDHKTPGGTYGTVMTIIVTPTF